MAKNDSTDDTSSGRAITLERTVTIHRSASDLHAFWRDISTLRELLPDAVTVREKTKQRSHWSVRVPGGKTLEWDAEVVEDRPARVIAWESCAGADVANSGSVHFEPQSGSRDATKVKIEIRYRLPDGLLGAALGKAVRGRAAEEMSRGLRTVKQRLESESPDADH